MTQEGEVQIFKLSGFYSLSCSKDSNFQMRL